MDRRARTPEIAFTASDQEVLNRAAIEVDLPGLLRAYGWRAVRGEDSEDRRVLTNAAGKRRIVVSRHPEGHYWQWWDKAVKVVGTIVDAMRQLLGFQLWRDIILLLRRALDDPPGPLPVLKAGNQGAVSNLAIAPSTIEPLHPIQEQHHEQSMHVSGPDRATVSAFSEEPVENAEGAVIDDAEVATDKPTGTKGTSDVKVPDNGFVKPRREGGRRR